MSKNSSISLTCLSVVIAIYSFGLPAIAVAQEESTAEELTEEIIVTARRREENLQEVPISIEAFTGEEMFIRGMERIDNVVSQTPNVFVVGQSTGGAGFSMRGIPDVGFFLDDIWQQSQWRLKDRSVLEIENIELLRGPQGTLFGRDTTGGAIKVYTRKPAEEFGGRVIATVGSYDRFDISANIDIPVHETLLTKLTLSREKRDGYVDSVIVDRSYGEIEDELVRGDLLWKPTEKLETRLILEHSKQRTTHTAVSTVLFDPDPPGPGPAFGRPIHPRQYYEILGFQYDDQSHASGFPGGDLGEFETKTDIDQDHGVVTEMQAATLNIQYDFSDTLSIRSLTGWRDTENAQMGDFDTSEFDYFEQSDVHWEDGWTQEFQLSGTNFGGSVNWVAGVFLWDTEARRRSFRWVLADIARNDFRTIARSPFCNNPAFPNPGRQCPPGRNRDQLEGQQEEGYAVFGEFTFDVTDTLSVTFGARYHDEDNETWSEDTSLSSLQQGDLEVGTRLNPGDSAAMERLPKTGSISASFDKTTLRVAIANQFTDDFMAYASYSEGFNAGGAEVVTDVDADGNNFTRILPFSPENIESIEIGFRSDWLDGRLRVNGTYFWTDWKNMIGRIQVTGQFTGLPVGASASQNVAESEAEGLELSVDGQVTDNFSFNFGLGVLDTKYTKILEGVRSIELGQPFGQSPELQYNIGAQWNQPLTWTGGELTLRLDYSWTDEYIRTRDPDLQIGTFVPGRPFEQDSFGILNARLVWTNAKGNLELSAYGTNLTDEFYLNGGFSPLPLGKDYASIGRPREAGVSAKFSF